MRWTKKVACNFDRKQLVKINETFVRLTYWRRVAKNKKMLQMKENNCTENKEPKKSSKPVSKQNKHYLFSAFKIPFFETLFTDYVYLSVSPLIRLQK
jgi:hypothetical protein